jgi:hypothetical protein
VEKGRSGGKPTARCPTPGSAGSEASEHWRVKEQTLLGEMDLVATGVGKFGEPEGIETQRVCCGCFKLFLFTQKI